MGWPQIKMKDCLLSINLPFKPEKFFQMSWKVDVTDLVVIGNWGLRCDPGQESLRPLGSVWLSGRKSWSGFVCKVQISTGSSSKFWVLISGSGSLTRFAVFSQVNGTWVGLNGFEVIVLLLNFRSNRKPVRVNKVYLWVGRGISRHRRRPSAHWRVAFGFEFSGQSLHRCPTLRHLMHRPSCRS